MRPESNGKMNKCTKTQMQDTKYTKDTKESVIKKIQRISKPGLRKYASSKELPRILNGLGIAIVSTSHGVMTGKQAQRENVGGEILCYVY